MIKSSEFKAVKNARLAAKHQLEFYNKMMIVKNTYEDNKTYPILMPNGMIREMSGKEINYTLNSDLTLKQKYDIIVDTLFQIKDKNKLAYDALVKIGEIQDEEDCANR